MQISKYIINKADIINYKRISDKLIKMRKVKKIKKIKEMKKMQKM